jgi:hypothetical protein
MLATHQSKQLLLGGIRQASWQCLEPRQQANHHTTLQHLAARCRR